jgi:hypothetical protein
MGRTALGENVGLGATQSFTLAAEKAPPKGGERHMDAQDADAVAMMLAEFALEVQAKIERMRARPRQGRANGLNLLTQRVSVAVQPAARKLIGQRQAKRGVVPARPVPERFCAHWRSTHGREGWLGFSAQIENGDGG